MFSLSWQVYCQASKNGLGSRPLAWEPVKNKLIIQLFWLWSGSEPDHHSIISVGAASSCRLQAGYTAATDFYVRQLVRVLQKAINPSVRERFLRCKCFALVFPWFFNFCRGSVHHVASLPLVGMQKPLLLNFCVFFLALWQESTTQLLGKVLTSCLEGKNPLLTVNCSGTFSSCAGTDSQKQFFFHLLRRPLISVMIV